MLSLSVRDVDGEMFLGVLDALGEGDIDDSGIDGGRRETRRPGLACPNLQSLDLQMGVLEATRAASLPCMSSAVLRERDVITGRFGPAP